MGGGGGAARSARPSALRTPLSSYSRSPLPWPPPACLPPVYNLLHHSVDCWWLACRFFAARFGSFQSVRECRRLEVRVVPCRDSSPPLFAV